MIRSRLHRLVGLVFGGQVSAGHARRGLNAECDARDNHHVLLLGGVVMMGDGGDVVQEWKHWKHSKLKTVIELRRG